jgi:hypothetical protein
MKITKHTTGWCANKIVSKDPGGMTREGTALVIVDFQLDGDPATYSAFVVLIRGTGKLEMPTYFRNVGAASILDPSAGEGLQFPVETRLEVEEAAREYARRKKLVA